MQLGAFYVARTRIDSHPGQRTSITPAPHLATNGWYTGIDDPTEPLKTAVFFIPKKGKGLACYLARQGFDVYVADLRGRGKSKPAIDKDADYGQTEAITQDLPAFIRYVFEQTGQNMHLVAHSWGGVLLASTLARFAELRPKILSKVCFGTKTLCLVCAILSAC